MGGGTDVALETADTALLNSRVTDVAALVGLSRATLANIHQNVAVALGLKVVFVVTTLAGVTGLWPAVLADTGATVLVTLNALRLLHWRPTLSRPRLVSNRDEDRRGSLRALRRGRRAESVTQSRPSAAGDRRPRS